MGVWGRPAWQRSQCSEGPGVLRVFMGHQELTGGGSEVRDVLADQTPGLGRPSHQFNIYPECTGKLVPDVG